MIVKPKPVTINVVAIVSTITRLINKLINFYTIRSPLVVKIFNPIINGIVRSGP